MTMKLRKKLASLLTSLALSCSLLACMPAQTVTAADAGEPAQLSVQNTIDDAIVYESGLLRVIETDKDVQPIKRGEQAYTSTTAASGQTDADLIRYCGSRNNYTCLGTYSNGAKIQQFYNQMYDAMVQLWDQTITLPGTSYNNEGECYYLDMFSYKAAGISYTDARRAYTAMRLDNPIFYFMSSTIVSNQTFGYVCPMISKGYVTDSSRKSAQASIKSFLKTIAGKINWKYTNYYKALVINNYIVNNCTYAYDSPGKPSEQEYAHSISGPIFKKKGVCEAYAKLFQLCLNYVGVDCIYVHGKGGSEAHAWNIVKLDDGKYYNYDTTWNDSEGYNYYLAKGTALFYQSHTPYSSSGTNYEWQGTLPTVSASDYRGTKATYKTLTSSFQQSLANVKAINKTYTTATVRWDIPVAADGVYVYLYNESAKKYTQVAKKSHYDNEFKFTGLKPGTTYKVLLKTYYVYNGKELTSTNGNSLTLKSIELPSGAATVTRYAGSNRYGTAVEISKAAASSSEYVIIASGSSYADALAGVPLASALNAPILLSAKDSVDAGTMTQIKKLGAKKAIILGGKSVVSDKVEKELISNGFSKKNIERIAGSNRFETSVAIANKLKALKGAPTGIFFVYYNGFADALSVGSVAGYTGAPILYLKDNGILDASTKSYLDSLTSKVSYGFIIGGPKLISSNAEQNVQNYFEFCKRIYGNDRYETSLMVNSAFNSNEVYTPYIATGLNFPDALAGGVLAAQKAQPIFLVGKSLTDQQVTELKKHKVKNIYVFGGNGAVSNELAYEAAAACAA